MAWLRALPLLLALPASGKSKPAAPVAVEARFKERITEKLEVSLSAASRHLALVLGVAEEGKGSKTFGRYELELAGKGKWRSSCESDIVTGRDSITLCALRKLQALTALCNVDGAVQEYRKGIVAALKALLGKRDKVVPGLGIKRSYLPVSGGLEGWLYEKEPGSGEFDINVAIHAAAVLTLVQCGRALDEKELFQDAHMWFLAVEKVYPKKLWEKMPFHSNSILWESFSLISAAVHRESSFSEGIKGFLQDFESYLLTSFEDNSDAWSFSSAHAAVLSWTTEKKPSRKKRLSKALSEHLSRWKALAPKLNATEAYTCGPMQGVAPLLALRGAKAAESVSSVLRLVEKDMDLFQIFVDRGDGEPSAAARRLGSELLAAQGKVLEGAFLRDSQQLRHESRATVRVDDTAQCVLTLVRTLQLLETLVGVEVPEEGAGAQEGAKPEEEAAPATPAKEGEL